MKQKSDYKLQQGIKYDYLEKINAPEIMKNRADKWFKGTRRVCRHEYIGALAH